MTNTENNTLQGIEWLAGANQDQKPEKTPFRKPVDVHLTYAHQIGTYPWISVDVYLHSSESMTSWTAELTPAQTQTVLAAIGPDPHERRIGELHPGINSWKLKDGPGLVAVMTVLKLGIELQHEKFEFKHSELDKDEQQLRKEFGKGNN